jgi:hypothetical protein
MNQNCPRLSRRTNAYPRRDRKASTTQSNDQGPSTSRSGTRRDSDRVREGRTLAVVGDGNRELSTAPRASDALRLAWKGSGFIPLDEGRELLTTAVPVGLGLDGRIVVEHEWIRKLRVRVATDSRRC